MTTRTAYGIYMHFLMTSHTLKMIGGKESRFAQIFRIKVNRMTASAKGRFIRMVRGTVMMTPPARCQIILMKGICQAVIMGYFKHFSNNHGMGES